MCDCATCACGGDCDENCSCGAACACRAGRARKIWILGVDCAKTTVPMVRWFIENLATSERDECRVVHVIPGTFPASDSVSALMGDFYPVTVPDEEQETAWRNEALRWMDEHVVPLLDEASIAYKIDIVPYDTNVSSVGEIMVEKSTLIDDAVAVVLASSSKGRIREFFIGSVCNYCLHRCKKPVIVYKPSEADEKAEEERVQTTQKAASSDDKEKAKDK